jgi:hypothetical protein
VTLENVATMAIEDESFQPYKTPKNRQATGLWTGLALILFLVSMIAFAVTAGGGGLVSVAGLIAIVSLIVCLVSAWFAIRLVLAMNRVEDFHRLRIGASDGRQLTLVDDNRTVLENIRDTIRNKIDTNDFETEGVFDLDTDTVKLSTDPEPEPDADPEEIVREAWSVPDAEAADEPETNEAEEATEPDFEPEDEIVLGEDDDKELEEKLAALLKGEDAKAD